MTIVDWIPLIVTALSIAGAASTYAYQRRVDRGATLLERRREVYGNYVIIVQQNLIGIRNDTQYQASLANIFIFGTDSVVRAVAEFHNEIADKNGKINGQKAATAYAAMVAAMRKDCFEASDLSVEQLKKLVPFKYDRPNP